MAFLRGGPFLSFPCGEEKRRRLWRRLKSGFYNIIKVDY